MNGLHPHRGTLRTAVFFAGLAVALVSMGCAGPLTPIKTLLDDPSRFDGDNVRIVGSVEGSVGALGVGTYQIDDGTGTLRVVTKSGGAPRDGARVGVAGTFRSAFNVGLESVAVLVEKSRFTP